MSSPVESQAATNNVDETIEFEDDANSADISAKVNDVVDATAINNDPSVVGAFKGSQKRKSKKSKIWQYFVDVEVEKKRKIVQKTVSLLLKKKYKVVIGGPISTLMRHIQAYPYIKRSKGKLKVLSILSYESGTVPNLNPSRGYDQCKCREIIAKLIIAHELPFAFVKYQWFNILMKYNNPL